MKFNLDKVEKMEMEVERKAAEIAEKLLLANENLADMQSKMFKKEAGNKKDLQTLEEGTGASFPQFPQFVLSKD